MASLLPKAKSKGNVLLIKIGTICALAGLVAGIAGTLFFSNYNPKDESIGAAASVVFGRIVKQNELVSVSQDYSIVDKRADANSFFDLFDIPFTGNSFWYRYQGTIKAGVNLETAEISTQGNQVTIALDPAYIISNTPDMENSGVLEENNNVLNPIQIEDVDEFQRWCIEQSQADAIEGGLLDDAKTEAEKQISQLLYVALEDGVSVQFNWRETPTD